MLHHRSWALAWTFSDMGVPLSPPLFTRPFCEDVTMLGRLAELGLLAKRLLALSSAVLPLGLM